MEEPSNVFLSFSQSPIEKYYINSLVLISRSIGRWTAYLKDVQNACEKLDQKAEKSLTNLGMMFQIQHFYEERARKLAKSQKK